MQKLPLCKHPSPAAPVLPSINLGFLSSHLWRARLCPRASVRDQGRRSCAPVGPACPFGFSRRRSSVVVLLRGGGLGPQGRALGNDLGAPWCAAGRPGGFGGPLRHPGCRQGIRRQSHQVGLPWHGAQIPPRYVFIISFICNHSPHFVACLHAFIFADVRCPVCILINKMFLRLFLALFYRCEQGAGG